MVNRTEARFGNIRFSVRFGSVRFVSVFSGKLKTVTVDVVKKESMLLRWRLDCSDRVGIVTGYAGKIFFRKQFQIDSRLLRVVLFGGRI